MSRPLWEATGPSLRATKVFEAKTTVYASPFYIATPWRPRCAGGARPPSNHLHLAPQPVPERWPSSAIPTTASR